VGNDLESLDWDCAVTFLATPVRRVVDAREGQRDSFDGLPSQHQELFGDIPLDLQRAGDIPLDLQRAGGSCGEILEIVDLLGDEIGLFAELPQQLRP
jgi:hypothetical protein